jgi:hypothetical protein
MTSQPSALVVATQLPSKRMSVPSQLPSACSRTRPMSVDPGWPEDSVGVAGTGCVGCGVDVEVGAAVDDAVALDVDDAAAVGAIVAVAVDVRVDVGMGVRVVVDVGDEVDVAGSVDVRDGLADA